MSTYSPDLRIELIANGDQAGTWGTTTNTNLGTIIEDAISGYITVSVTSANQAFTALNGAADEARNAMIRLTTTTSNSFAVYAPPSSKQYTIFNDSSYTATIYNSTVIGNTTAAGTGIAVPAGKIMSVWSNGTDFYKNSTALVSLTTDVSGILPVANGGTGAGDAATARTNLNVPTRTGGDASGTWAINISGNAATATSATTATTATTATSPAGGGTFITSLNIGSQSVNYATNAGYPNSGGTFITSANIGSQSVASATTATSPAGGGTFITSLNIGSQSVNYATNAGYPNSGGTFITSANIGSQSVSFASSAQNAVYADLPSSGGTFITSSNIGSQSVNYATNAGFPNSGGTFITSANIGSQSVASATTATTAGNVSGIVAIANGGTAASTASGARTNLGLAIGTNVPSPTGTGASGTWAINITGNAATASNAGFPSYSSGSRSTITYDSLWQAPSNGIVTISAVGSYINGLQVEVGSTSSLGTVIAILANDFNNNTWGQSFSFPIKSGSYAKVSRWSGSSYDFETINIYFWTVS